MYFQTNLIWLKCLWHVIFTIVMLIRAKMTHFWVLYLKKYLLYGYFCEIPKNSMFFIIYLFWIENCVLWQKLSGKNTLLLNLFTEKWKNSKSNDFPQKKSIMICEVFWPQKLLRTMFIPHGKFIFKKVFV